MRARRCSCRRWSTWIAGDVARIVAAADDLAGVRTDVESFGPGAVLVREMPALLGNADCAAASARYRRPRSPRTSAPAALERSLDQVLATLACHNSVRAGRRLSGRRDERAAARDGSDAGLRPVQPRPPDLCRIEARRYRAAVQTAVMTRRCIPASNGARNARSTAMSASTASRADATRPTPPRIR